MHSSSKVFLENTNTQPEIAVILGSGLTNFFEPQNVIKEIPYTDLPDFPQPTVKGHAGKLVLGEIASNCLLYTSPSPRDLSTSRMPSSA